MAAPLGFHLRSLQLRTIVLLECLVGDEMSDGVCRPVIGVNGHWPIRPLVVDKGSHYTLRVFNNLDDTTVYDYVQNITIHTHGIDEPGTTYFDGVDGVTQW